jgi:beta-phosphoglucomutase
MALEGIIFDLDGVIVNTVPLHFKAWKQMFNGYGKKFSFKDYKQKVDGIPRMSGARAILTESSQEQLNEAAAKKQEYFLKLLKSEGIKVYPSTINFIEILRKNNLKVAVISSSKNCLFILEKAKLVDLFDVIITGNDIKKGKPDPDVFLLAAEKLNLNPQNCLVFEDAVLGVEAAKNAKMKVVGIDRYFKPERLKDADLIINDLKEISLSKIKELFSS